jgi:hypothetical protein
VEKKEEIFCLLKKIEKETHFLLITKRKNFSYGSEVLYNKNAAELVYF